MIQVVNDIKKLLGITEPVLTKAISKANEMMGIASEGTLPLYDMLDGRGLFIATDPGRCCIYYRRSAFPRLHL